MPLKLKYKDQGKDWKHPPLSSSCLLGFAYFIGTLVPQNRSCDLFGSFGMEASIVSSI